MRVGEVLESLVDPELERMAETQGASPWQAFRHVTLPLAFRGILAGAGGGA
jgi:molybdate transport system permease protein